MECGCHAKFCDNFLNMLLGSGVSRSAPVDTGATAARPGRYRESRSDPRHAKPDWTTLAADPMADRVDAVQDHNTEYTADDRAQDEQRSNVCRAAIDFHRQD